MKEFTIFKDSFKDEYKIYKLTANKNFYESLTEKGMGFPLQTTIDNPNAFKKFETLKDAEMYIREIETCMVNAEDANVFCPKCERGYEAFDKSDTEYVWVYTKECACGHQFKIEGRQTITYKVI